MTVRPHIDIEEHPLLRLAAFTTHFPAPLRDLSTPEEIRRLLESNAPAPLERADDDLHALDHLRCRGR